MTFLLVYQLTSWLTLHIQLRMSCYDLGRVGDTTQIERIYKKAGWDDARTHMYPRRMVKVKTPILTFSLPRVDVHCITDDRPSGSETRAQEPDIDLPRSNSRGARSSPSPISHQSTFQVQVFRRFPNDDGQSV